MTKFRVGDHVAIWHAWHGYETWAVKWVCNRSRLVTLQGVDAAGNLTTVSWTMPFEVLVAAVESTKQRGAT